MLSDKENNGGICMGQFLQDNFYTVITCYSLFMISAIIIDCIYLCEKTTKMEETLRRAIMKLKNEEEYFYEVKEKKKAYMRMKECT